MSEQAGPAYRIETARLLVRCWAPEDARPLRAAIEANLDELAPWLRWIQNYPMSDQQQLAELRRMRRRFDGDKDYCYGVFDRHAGDLVGGCGLHTRSGPSSRELGYWIRPERWRQGLATELAAALTRVAFEVDRVERVDVRCELANLASARVSERLGFRHEATLRRRLGSADFSGLRDGMLWTMIREEFLASAAATRSAGIAAFDPLGDRLPL
jgi:RimJ/RimL family protein N-acetyltransferase